MARIKKKLVWIVSSCSKLIFIEVYSFGLSDSGINYFVLNYDGNMMQNELFVFKFYNKTCIKLPYLESVSFNFIF